MSNQLKLGEILAKFNITSNIEEYGNGHINDTYLTHTPSYILQRINTAIFKDPEKLMENIDNVTGFLRKKIIEAGGDPARETLTVIKTADGKNFYTHDENNVFRVYDFVTDTRTIETSKSREDLYNAGKCYGKFQKMLGDFPVETLHETIADFHNTPKRVDALKKAVADDLAGRAQSVKAEIDFALSCAHWAGTVVDDMAKGLIPSRVTHNDTKINNLLFEKNSSEAICVIDLDTVMPGSALYDFGDALRMGGSTGAEDETNLDLVNFDGELFEYFTEGFLEALKEELTEREIELLPFSVKLLTYECGIRFLTDYLNGDTYFKIHRPEHNLDRARNQFKLVRDIESKEAELSKIVEKIVRK